MTLANRVWLDTDRHHLIQRSAVRRPPDLERAFEMAYQLVRVGRAVALKREPAQSICAGVAGRTRESCGVLLGHSADGRIVVERAVRARNFSRRPGSFMLSLASIAGAIEETATEEFLGVFHSHAGSALPSRADIRSMRATRCLWLIVSPHGLGAYRVNHVAVESLPIEGG